MTTLVVDTSALVASATGEPGAEWIDRQLTDADVRLIAAPTVVELGIVLEARDPAATGIAARLVKDAQLEVVSFDADLADRALIAWRRFGRGRAAARPNLGDCFTYALADREGLPILCVGDHFAQTDLELLRPPSA